MRTNLSAAALMDLVDFVKHEDKYLARLKELDKREADMKDLLGIVNTKEQADKLVEKAKEAAAQVVLDRQAMEKDIAEQRANLDRVAKQRSDEINKKIADMQSVHKRMEAATKTYQETEQSAAAMVEKSKKMLQEAKYRLDEADKVERKLREKVETIKKVMES